MILLRLALAPLLGALAIGLMFALFVVAEFVLEWVGHPPGSYLAGAFFLVVFGWHLVPDLPWDLTRRKSPRRRVRS